MINVAHLRDLIQSTIETHNPADTNEKILLCGSWSAVSPCLEHISENMSTEVIFPHLVVASDEIESFLPTYENKHQIELVDWNEHNYEQELIERVKSKHDTERRIHLAIDLQPSPRRMLRIRNLLEPTGTLVISYEKPLWRAKYGEQIRSFTACGGRLINLSSSAGSVQQPTTVLGGAYRMGMKWSTSVSGASRER